MASSVTALIAPTLLIAQASSAEQPATQISESDTQIVVEAPPTQLERQRELRRMASDVLRPVRRGETVATFFAAMCPKVFGAPQEVAEAIETRIRFNAERFGANRRNPSENCRHNISVILVPPQEGPATEWFDDESRELRHLLSFQRARVLNEQRPVRSWVYSQTRTQLGGAQPNPAGRPLNQVADFSNRIWSASRLRSPVTAEISAAVILIELESVDGKTINQIADYATMRTFANTGQIDAETAPAAPTILTLFQDDEPPAELTTFDRAFISRLYGTRRASFEWRYLSNIAATAARMELEEASATLAQ